MKHRMMEADVWTIVRKAVLSAKAKGKEICSLLIDNGHFIELHQTTNRSRAGGSFCFDKREIRTLVRSATTMRHTIVGTFHSHPTATSKPGSGDIQNAVDPSLMLILDCTSKTADLWSIKAGKAKKAKLELKRV